MLDFKAPNISACLSTCFSFSYLLFCDSLFYVEFLKIQSTIIKIYLKIVKISSALIKINFSSVKIFADRKVGAGKLKKQSKKKDS